MVAAALPSTGQTAERDTTTISSISTLTIAECQYALLRFPEVSATANLLHQQARTPMEMARAVFLRKNLLEVEGRVIDALGLCLDALRELGVPFPNDEDIEPRLEQEIAHIERLRAGRHIESLAQLPVLEDERVTAIIFLPSISFVPIAGTGRLARQLLVGALIVRHSLEWGLCGEAALGIVQYAVTWARHTNDFQAGACYSRLGLAVAKRFEHPRHFAEAAAGFFCTLEPYVLPWAASVAHGQEIIDFNRRQGHTLWAAYVSLFQVWDDFFSGVPLDSARRRTTVMFEWLRDAGMTVFHQTLRIQLNLIDTLQGESETAGSLDGAGVAARQYSDTIRDGPHGLIVGGDPPVHIAHLVTSAMVLDFLWGRHRDVLAWLEAGRHVLAPYDGTNLRAITSLFGALSSAALAADTEGRRYSHEGRASALAQPANRPAARRAARDHNRECRSPTRGIRSRIDWDTARLG